MLFAVFSFGQIEKPSSGSPAFIKNKGQIIDQTGKPNPNVLYLLNTPGLKVQLKKNGFSYDTYEPGEKPQQEATSVDIFNKKKIGKAEKKRSRKLFHRIDFEFVNANPKVQISEMEETEFFQNFYNVPGIETGITGVRSFKRIYYRELYPGIDMEFFVPTDPAKPVEYNFIVHPAGKIEDIRMKISGANVICTPEQLELNLIHGALSEIIPASWNGQGKQKNPVFINYTQLEENIFGFKYANTSQRKENTTLTIDPTPIREWATYFGGEKDESYLVGDVATDAAGNVFITGHTESLNNIATTGSAQITFDAWRTGFIAKFNKDGNLLWSTYYGRKETTLRSITIDGSNKIIIGGMTNSDTNISTPGSHQEYLDGHDTNYLDGLVAKFSNDGILEWGTYYGGELMEVGTAVVTDKNENIYFAGFTTSHESITTPGSFKDDREVYGETLGFLVKFDKNGNRQWGTFYDGEGIEELGLDNSGNVFLVGYTEKRTGVASPGAYQENFNEQGSPWTEAFLAKFTPAGQRAWGTYFGGTDYEFGYGLAVDSEGNLIIGGGTRSNDQIGITGAHQEEKGGAPNDFDGFLAKFGNNGDFMWSTYYGGENADGITDVAVDASDNIFAFGATLSTTQIATEDVYQENFNSSSDLYLAKFNPSGERIWGTYYGGNNADQSLTMDIGKDGAILLLGYTFSTLGLTSPGAYQEQNGGFMDVILIKLRDCLSAITVTAPAGVCEGENLEFTASGGISYLWTGPNGFNSTSPNPVIPAAGPAESGTYSVFIVSGTDCDDTRTFEVLVSPAPVAYPISDINACEDEPGTGVTSTFNISAVEAAVLQAQSGMEVSWYDDAGNLLSVPTATYTNTTPHLETLTLRVANSSNPSCYAETSFDLIIHPLPGIIVPDDLTICDNDTDGFSSFQVGHLEKEITGNDSALNAVFLNTSGEELDFSGTFQNTEAGSQTIRVQVINENTGCSTEFDFNLLVQPAPISHSTDDLIGCDNDGDGISEYFDVSGVVAQILQGQTDHELSYYRSDGSEILNFTSPYTNSEPYEEMITVKITNHGSGCYAETTLTLKTSAAPKLNTLPTNYSCDEGSGFGNFDTSVWTQSIIGNQTGLKVTYYGQNGSPLPNPLPALYRNSVPYAEKITVKVENELNPLCVSETRFELVIKTKQELDLQETYNLCDLEPFLKLNPDGEFDTWEWKDLNGIIISNTSEVSLPNAGNYTVTVTDTENGITCENSYDFELVRSQLPSIVEVNYKEWSSNNYIEIIAGGDGDLEYSIDGINFQDSNYFANITGGVYIVFARDKKGCGMATQEVILVDYPKFFSPNQDGYNDQWQLQGFSQQPETFIFIFDRYGKLLKQLSSHSSGWDGTFNGKIMPPNDYWFSVSLKDGREFKGHFSLIL